MRFQMVLHIIHVHPCSRIDLHISTPSLYIERDIERERESEVWHLGHCRLDRHPRSCFCNDSLGRKHGNGKSLRDSIPSHVAICMLVKYSAFFFYFYS